MLRCKGLELRFKSYGIRLEDLIKGFGGKGEGNGIQVYRHVCAQKLVGLGSRSEGLALKVRSIGFKVY